MPQQNLLDPVGHAHRTWHKRNASLHTAGQPRRGRPQLIAQLSYTAGHDKQDPANTLLLTLTSIAIATMPEKKVRSQIERMTYASLAELRKLKRSDRRAADLDAASVLACLFQ